MTEAEIMEQINKKKTSLEQARSSNNATAVKTLEEEIKQLESVLTIVNGRAVYAAEEFRSLAPPLPPVLPEWSPIATYGGYAKPVGIRVGAHSHTAHRHACSNREVPGGFGCLCWAF